ncbi:alpha/beta fold hydrolase [Streptomyces sp. NPDC018045]|uniref:alpha/beta fold hydrolase n=1 Tax=Streptomyces sp. NPDC018045 TaxID=3365037 RepID=UPI0037983C0C
MTRRSAWHPLQGNAARATPRPGVIAAAHGLQGDWRMWEPLARHLPADVRVYALDLPWRAGNDYRWRRTADAPRHLAQALRTLPERPDLLVAHSFGANAALGYLTRAHSGTSRLRAAVLAAPFFRTSNAPADRDAFARHRETLQVLMAEAVRGRVGHRAQGLGEAVLASMARTAAARLPPQALVALRDSYRTSGTLDLRAVRVPVLVVAGEDDPSAGVDQGRALAEGLPTAALRVHPSVGHFLTYQAPEPFAADIETLLTLFPETETAASPLLSLLNGLPAGAVPGIRTYP